MISAFYLSASEKRNEIKNEIENSGVPRNEKYDKRPQKPYLLPISQRDSSKITDKQSQMSFSFK